MMQLEITVVESVPLGTEGMVCHLKNPPQSQGLRKDAKQGFWKHIGADSPVHDETAPPPPFPFSLGWLTPGPEGK